MNKIQKIIFILIYTLLVTAAGFAETYTWTGNIDDDWGKPGNWQVGGSIASNYPNSLSDDNVEIPGGLTQYPVINKAGSSLRNVTVNLVDIGAGATLTIKCRSTASSLTAQSKIAGKGKIIITVGTGNRGNITIHDMEFLGNPKIGLTSGIIEYTVKLEADTLINFRTGLEAKTVSSSLIDDLLVIDTPKAVIGGGCTFMTEDRVKFKNTPGVELDIRGTFTAQRSVTLPNNANTNITSSGTVNLEQSFIFSDIKWIASNGTITAKDNFSVPNFKQTYGSLNLSGGGTQNLNIEQAYNLKIESLSTTTLIENIKILNSFYNNGTFNTDMYKTITFTGSTFTNTGSFTTTSGDTVILNPPANGTVTITGTSTATNTKFHNLKFIDGGGKTLTIDGKIFVEDSLTLEGSGITDDKLLTITGASNSSSIELNNSMLGGKWLKVKTNIPIESPHEYRTAGSKPYGSNIDLAAGKPFNWVFDSPTALIWTGKIDTNWNNQQNWVPRNPVPTAPTESTNVIIPSGCTNYPELTSPPPPAPPTIYKAKHVTVEAGAELNLKGTIIEQKSLDNHGTVYMEGSAAQKIWLEMGSPSFAHKSSSTIIYQNVIAPNAGIWQGPYKKLKFASGVPGTIKAASLVVEEQLTVNKSITLDTGSGNQTYNDTINAGGYDITLKGSTIKTKDVTANKIKVIGTWNSQGGDITSATDIEAATWTSWGGITAKNINITDELVFNGGIIRVGGDLTAKKLNASSNAAIRGLIIFNGSGTQKLSGKDGNNIIDGKIQNLQIESGATLQLESDITITVGLNNQGVFDAVTNSKKVTLEHKINEIKIEGKTNKDDTKFHNLICTTTTAGRLLKIDGEISVTGDLILSGASGNLLTIYGSNDAKIHLIANHDLDSSNNAKGNFLRIYTGSVKIQPQSNYYVVKDSEDNNGLKFSKNGWIFVKPNLTIVNSFAKPNDNHIYLLFNDTGLSLEEFKVIGSSNLTITDSGGTLLYSSILENTVQSGRTWKIELNRPISVDDILTNTHKVKLDYFGTLKEKIYISDIGIDMVKPLKAFNSIVLYDFGAEPDDPSLVTLDVTIPSVIAGSNDVKLYFISKDSPGSFWYPNPPLSSAPSNLSSFASSQSGTHEYSPIPDGGANQIKFIVPSTDSYLVKDKVGQFMFVYKGWLPCARLTDSNDILSFDVWNFKIVGVQKQKGGVSVFNNVINPNKNQEATIGAHLKKSGILTIQIMTLDGNVIRTLERSHKDAGDHFVNWDGRNNGGNPVASGMYFVRIAGPEIDEVRKILVVK